MSILGNEIRQLSASDAALFREIRLESLKQNPEAFTSSYDDEVETPLVAFEDELRQSTIFGAFRDNELVGIAALSAQAGRRKAYKGTIWAVYVRPRARNMGIASMLLEAILNSASGPFTLLQLNVNVLNQHARQLYERYGFSAYGIEKYAVRDDHGYTDNVLMMKILKPMD